MQPSVDLAILYVGECGVLRRDRAVPARLGPISDPAAGVDRSPPQRLLRIASKEQNNRRALACLGCPWL